MESVPLHSVFMLSSSQRRMLAIKPDVEALCKKYIENPPEGMSSEGIRHMSGDKVEISYKV